MKDFDVIRKKIKQAVVSRISAVKEVCSITFVGSFVNTGKITSVSDVDIIVITDQLNESVFRSVERRALEISGAECGLSHFRVRLNMSFGPLKFNDPDTIVLHLMVYDRAGHRKHVIESPFTCCDWEYHIPDYGIPLSGIYPARPLQFDDLIGTRRSLESYLEDLHKGVITYRYYSFEKGITEVKATYQIDDRHRKEYAYHVVKYLMLNLQKILYQQNCRFTDKELAQVFSKHDPLFNVHAGFFLELSDWKRQGETEPQNIIARAEEFIKVLGSWFIQVKESLPSVTFYRHGKTPLNDGCFLGIGRDPSILPVDPESVPAELYDAGFSSKMKRGMESLELLQCKTREATELLNEIDYGDAEGLSFIQLKQRYPDVVDGWQRRDDPPFPNGENQADVARRLQQFLSGMIMNSDHGKIAVITHNVVLRCLLGQCFNADTVDWFLLQPGHFEAIRFRLYNGKLIPDLSDEQRVRYKDQLIRWQEEA
jgi:alpha-ribazole phosphatase